MGVERQVLPPKPPKKPAKTWGQLSPQEKQNGLNGLSVLGLGKLMPLGNIGMALIQEQQKQTALLERQTHLLELLVERMGLQQDGGHL